MKERLLIIGSGEFAQQVMHYALINGNFEIVGFIDKYKDKGELINGFPVLGSEEDIPALYESNKFDKLFIGIGYAHFALRDNLYNSFKDHIPFATIIVNPSYLDSTAKIGEGSILYPGCLIDRNVIVEPNVVVNLGVLIGHASIIGQSSFIAANASFGGFTKIGKRCFVGIQAVIKDNTSVGEDISIGLGGVVVRNLKKKGTYFGVPVRRINDL